MVSVFKGKRHTDEYKIWASESRKGVPNIKRRGKGLWSEEDKKRIGDSKRGNTYTKGRKMAADQKEKMTLDRLMTQGKPIFVYDLSNNLLCEFSGIKQASRELNVCAATIRKSIKGLYLPKTNYYFKLK